VDRRGDLDAEKRKISSLCREKEPHHPTRSLSLYRLIVLGIMYEVTEIICSENSGRCMVEREAI
jgi:hypothetical protein